MTDRKTTAWGVMALPGVATLSILLGCGICGYGLLPILGTGNPYPSTGGGGAFFMYAHLTIVCLLWVAPVLAVVLVLAKTISPKVAVAIVLAPFALLAAEVAFIQIAQS